MTTDLGDGKAAAGSAGAASPDDSSHAPLDPAEALSYEWERWAALSLLLGTPPASAIATMVRDGVPEEQAARACGRIRTDPAFEAGRWVAQRLRKLESMLIMRQRMQDLAPPCSEVDRRRGLSRTEFLAQYYAPNRPVILEDVCDAWPALSAWTPDHLVAILGSAEVEVMADRDADPDYELNAGAHRSLMPFDEYVAKVTQSAWSNDLYLVANNKLLTCDRARPLWDDFTLDPRYLVPDTTRSVTFLWFGPAGTLTPLHHDVMNVLFHQVAGRKHFILISPLETHCVSNSVGVFSDVDPLVPDYERFPRFDLVHPFEVRLGPGEALFIPVGWWHHVLALDLSISLSTTSFAFPNAVAWAQPVRIF